LSARRITPRDLAVHGGLFAAACVTTWMSGGVWFAATLMGILLCHEMGHYVVARRHGVDVSLPYFIPMPPYFTFGTLGAVIKMKQPISDRDALLDVGAAGPLAGLAVAVPLLAIGLSLSEVGQILPGSTLEGNSLFYLGLKAMIFGRVLPDGSTDVQLHPMAFAAWVGILVTMINLIPIGQLDGGHVLRAWIGDRHEQVSLVLHKGLLAVAALVCAGMTIVARMWGHSWIDALAWAGPGAAPWLTWALLLLLLRRASDGVYHPPVGDGALTPGRRRLAFAVLLVFALIFTPVPLVPAL
jgi:membrane-associated protease RseP (regulator of RpoE activity)